MTNDALRTLAFGVLFFALGAAAATVIEIARKPCDCEQTEPSTTHWYWWDTPQNFSTGSGVNLDG